MNTTAESLNPIAPSAHCWLATAAAACALCTCQPAAAQHHADRGVDLQHLSLDLRLDWPTRQAHGTATLLLRPTRTTSRVALDAGRLAVESVTLASGQTLKHDYDGGDRDQGLVIMLDRSYTPQDTLTLQVRYRTQWVNHSDPQNLWGSTGKGIRFFEPTSSDLRKRQQAWTSGEATSSRFWYPDIDDPRDWRTTELSITVPAPLSAIAPGTLVDVRLNADGTRTHRFRMDTPHSNRRTLFVVGEYVDQPQAHPGVKLHNWGYPDEAQATADSVVLLPDMLRFFSDLTAAPFPYASYTQVFIQDFPWGHAGAGLALQTENMVDDHGTHHDFLYLWDGLQAEALAQQWFGGLLAACETRHAWLERGFAHHLSSLYAQQQNGRDEFLLWYVLGDQATVMADWAAGTRDALLPASGTDLSAFAAGNTPWARGAAVLHMLRQELGDETWRRVLQQHVRSHAGKPVCSDQFRRVVNDVAGRNLDWFFGQWLLRAEHPVFEVTQQHDAAAGELVMLVRQTQTSSLFQGHVGLDIDGQVHRVWLQPQALNRLTFALQQPPRLVHFDHESTWIKELTFTKTAAELLHQLRTTTDTPGRQWAMGELAQLVQADGTPASVKADFVAALRELAASRVYWRIRFNALNQLRTVLTPRDAGEPVVLDEATRQMLLSVTRNEGSWLRTAALRLLGDSRDMRYAALYQSYLKDTSDRVINAAAIALGKTRSEDAYAALTALPLHPSWKNQSLISALNGLKELGDPRGAALALQSLADVRSARWTLSTPVWDYRLAAVETLVALKQAGQAHALIYSHFEQSLQGSDVNDIFSNALLLAKLGDARAQAAWPALKQRFKGDQAASGVVTQMHSQWEAALKAAPQRP